MFFLSFSDVLLWHLLQELSSTVCTRLRESPSVKLHPAILYLAVHVSDIFFFSPHRHRYQSFSSFLSFVENSSSFFFLFSFSIYLFCSREFLSHLVVIYPSHVRLKSSALCEFFSSLNRISIFVSYFLWKQITAY